jgi:putative transposase
MAKGPKLQPIAVTPRQREIMEQIVRARCSDAGLVLRIKIVLGGVDGMSNSAVVRQYEVGHEAVRRWRTRWQAHRERLQEIESNAALVDEAERMKDLEAAIRDVLRDEHRSGAPATFSAQQQVKIIAVACEDPQASGRTISHWTPREIADEVEQRQIVETISARSVGRFLKRGADQAASESLLAQQHPRR